MALLEGSDDESKFPASSTDELADVLHHAGHHHRGRADDEDDRLLLEQSNPSRSFCFFKKSARSEPYNSYPTVEKT